MIRFPAEWEPQSALLLTYPPTESDWGDTLVAARATILEIAAQTLRFQDVIVVCENGAELRAELEQLAAERHLPAATFELSTFEFPANDSWARDHGPITVFDDDRPVCLDWTFNGWGLKYPANHDNQLTPLLHAAQALTPAAYRLPGFVLEGGALESDGRGTLLTTSRCLLSPNRNPLLDREDYAELLGKWLGTKRILWLDHGYLAGDDTDSHIDTLARFVAEDTIMYVAPPPPPDEHHAALSRMEAQLGTFRQPDGTPYQLIPLPWPTAQFSPEDGHRLPATYANFTLINGAVLVPTYDCPEDAEALWTIGAALPDREVIGIDCVSLIQQHGSLHCATIQVPKVGGNRD